MLKLSNPPGAYWESCVDSLTGNFTAFNTSDTVFVPFRATALCPEMRIDLEANRIRPCSTALVYLRWQNVGTAPADSVSITLTVPPNAQLTDAQLPAIDLGGGLYRFDIGPVAVGANSPGHQIPLVGIIPNPTHSTFTVHLRLDRAAEVRLKVYDLTGQLVHQVLTANRLIAGPHQFSIPAEAWPPGIYFLEIQTDGQKTVRKMVKQ